VVEQSTATRTAALKELVGRTSIPAISVLPGRAVLKMSPSTLLCCIVVLAGASWSQPAMGLASPSAGAASVPSLVPLSFQDQQAMRLRGGGAPGRKMSATQQAAAIPPEAMKFSTSFADKLTGGASSLPCGSVAAASPETDTITGEGGPLIASESVSQMPFSYDPRIMHMTDPWRRALVNDEPFAVQTKGRNLLVGSTIVVPLLPLSFPLSLPLACCLCPCG